MPAPSINQVISQQHVQDLLFLLAARFPFLAGPLARRFWSDRYAELVCQGDVREIPAGFANALLSLHEMLPVSPARDDVYGTELDRLEDAGLLRSTSITVDWPPPRMLTPGEASLFGNPLRSGLTDVAGLWLKTCAAGVQKRDETWERSPTRVRLLLATEKTREAINGTSRLAAPGDRFFAFPGDQPLPREFVASRLYVAAGVIEHWMRTGALEPLRCHPEHEEGEPDAVSFGEDFERRVFYCRSVPPEALAVLYLKAAARVAGGRPFRFELR